MVKIPDLPFLNSLSRTDFLELVALMPTLTSVGRIPIDHPDWHVHRMRLIQSYDIYHACEQWILDHGLQFHENTMQLKHAIENGSGMYVPQGVAILALQYVFLIGDGDRQGITFADHPELSEYSLPA